MTTHGLKPDLLINLLLLLSSRPVKMETSMEPKERRRTSVVTWYCGPPQIEYSDAYFMRRGYVYVDVSTVYMSVGDKAVALCRSVYPGKYVYGMAIRGVVLDVGVGVDKSIIGRTVVGMSGCVYGCCGLMLGEVEVQYVWELPKELRDDAYAVALGPLSVAEEVLRIVDGANILLIGEDISLLSFWWRAQQKSARISVATKFTPIYRSMKADHVSLFDSEKKYDVVVVASSNPLAVNLALRALKDCGTLIIHPSIKDMLLYTSSECVEVKLMKFGDFASAYRLYINIEGAVKDIVKFSSSSDTVYRAPAILSLRNLNLSSKY